MNAETTLSRIMDTLGLKSNTDKKEEQVEIQLEQKKTEDGQAIFDAEAFEVGQPIFVVTPDGNIPAPAGEFTLEGGMKVVVDEQGYIANVGDAMEEEEKEEVVEEVEQKGYPKKEEEMGGMAPSQPKKMTETLTKTMEYSEENPNDEIKKEIESLKMELSALKEEKEELLQRLSTEESPRRKHNPEATSKTQLKYQIGAKRTETIQDRIFNQLFN